MLLRYCFDHVSAKKIAAVQIKIGVAETISASINIQLDNAQRELAEKMFSLGIETVVSNSDRIHVDIMTKVSNLDLVSIKSQNVMRYTFDSIATEELSKLDITLAVVEANIVTTQKKLAIYTKLFLQLLQQQFSTPDLVPVLVMDPVDVAMISSIPDQELTTSRNTFHRYNVCSKYRKQRSHSAFMKCIVCGEEEWTIDKIDIPLSAVCSYLPCMNMHRDLCNCMSQWYALVCVKKNAIRNVVSYPIQFDSVEDAFQRCNKYEESLQQFILDMVIASINVAQ